MNSRFAQQSFVCLNAYVRGQRKPEVSSLSLVSKLIQHTCYLTVIAGLSYTSRASLPTVSNKLGADAGGRAPLMHRTSDRARQEPSSQAATRVDETECTKLSDLLRRSLRMPPPSISTFWVAVCSRAPLRRPVSPSLGSATAAPSTCPAIHLTCSPIGAVAVAAAAAPTSPSARPLPAPGRT
jgi:hypothetical protein